MKSTRQRETDLYPPLRAFFERLGFLVRSEVRDCDITATRGEEVVIVELKRSLNLSLLVQATARQALSELVYVAVPRQGQPTRGGRGARRILQRLQLGLICVDLDRPEPVVRIEFDPAPEPARIRRRNTRARRGLLAEIRGRSLELNTGGMSQRPIVTAYREAAVRLAVLLQELGPQPVRQLRAASGEVKAGPILYDNHYGWFERVSRGTYAITDRGRQDLDQYPELVRQCAGPVRSQDRQAPAASFRTALDGDPNLGEDQLP